jgi:hypothetical protein
MKRTYRTNQVCECGRPLPSTRTPDRYHVCACGCEWTWKIVHFMEGTNWGWSCCLRPWETD